MWSLKHPGSWNASPILICLIALSVPFSVKLYVRSWDLELIFPAEPLIAVAALVGAVRFLGRIRSDAMRDLFRSPLVLITLMMLFVWSLAALFSEMPLVSAKALIVRAAYVFVFFFMVIALPLHGPFGSASILGYHGLVLLAVLLYSFSGQVEGGLDRASAGFVSYPFYVDHTIYGAALVFACVFFGMQALRFFRVGDRGRASLSFALSIILGAGIFLSYARAAWLSLLVAFVAALIWAAHERWAFWTRVVTLSLVALVSGVGLQHLLRPEAVPVNSSAYRSGFRETIASFTNVSTDPSNLERLNRWSCAWRMFIDHPILGTGPGTYQFLFPPYQLPGQRSPISMPDSVQLKRMEDMYASGRSVLLRPRAIDMQYTGGSAHSEYLLALAETGAPGAIAMLGVLILGLWTGVRCVRSVPLPWQWGLAAASTLGLLAYGVHAVFNNFLDDCKIALPFWVSMAVLHRLYGLRNSRKEEVVNPQPAA